MNLLRTSKKQKPGWGFLCWRYRGERYALNPCLSQGVLLQQLLPSFPPHLFYFYFPSSADTPFPLKLGSFFLLSLAVPPRPYEILSDSLCAFPSPRSSLPHLPQVELIQRRSFAQAPSSRHYRLLFYSSGLVACFFSALTAESKDLNWKT